MIRKTIGRATAASLALLLTVACTPTGPQDGSGVGFSDYNSYIRGSAPPPVAPVTGAPAGGFDPAAAAAAIDQAEGVAPPTGLQPTDLQPTDLQPTILAEDRPRDLLPVGIKEESGEVDGIAAISDEQDFAAVSARETIESDAERIARNRAEYVTVQPGELPTRPGDTGPNIVEFALATSHAPGVQLYKRSGLGLRDQNAACAKYASPDKAQQDFLSKGGPERDRMGVDPDGDGFACSWDPRPFRTALQ
ncbi:MAG: hypothetical protein B7Z10_02305 [Rhodobacterales bacterium 32-66-7]|nr:MAG: hypothetical protein B7Z31_07915 [Rhodobacterales bacterium 12-65-15]OYX26737.1 MAG: hypothetical protein B7Z10_02305 [Rhodobacterales bacterium 32-66-7]